MLFLCFFLIANFMVACLWLPALRNGINVADEGYLLFGTQQCLKGKVPIRDFRAYDPGRYFWCSLWMKRLGVNYITLRFAMGLVMVVSLSFAGWIVQKATNNWLISVSGMLLCWLWLKPYFKIFEIFFSLLSIVIAYYLLIQPIQPIFFLAGFMVGAAFFWGSNIGLYLGMVTASGWGISVTVNDANLLGSLTFLVVGGGVGLLPIFIFGICNRGYLSKYWTEKIVTIFTRGSTNLTLPFPWIGKKVPQFNNFSPAKRYILSLIFVMLPFVYVFAIIMGGLTLKSGSGASAILVGSGITGLTYMHHLLSRCDITHMCQSYHPFLITILIFVSLVPVQPVVWMLLFLLITISFWIITTEIDEYYRFLRFPSHYNFYSVMGSTLIVKNNLIRLFQILEELLRKYENGNNHALFVPSMPGYYPLFNRKPACYDIFCVYPASIAKQQEMLGGIEKYRPPVVVAADVALDGRDDLRFKNTYPLVWIHLCKEYEKKTSIPGLPQHIKIFVLKEGAVEGKPSQDI